MLAALGILRVATRQRLVTDLDRAAVLNTASAVGRRHTRELQEAGSAIYRLRIRNARHRDDE
jgi:hypothetical protein